MTQQMRVSGVATNIRQQGQATIVRYHNTDVVKFTPTSIELDNGGWPTATTATRMNQASNQFGLGYGVNRKAGMMIVTYKGRKIPFQRSIKFPR